MWSLIKENSTFRIKFQCTCIPHFLGLPTQVNLPLHKRKSVFGWKLKKAHREREEVCGRNPITFLRENKVVVVLVMKKMQ